LYSDKTSEKYCPEVKLHAFLTTAQDGGGCLIFIGQTGRMCPVSWNS